MRKRRSIPTLPVDFFSDVTNKVKYQKMLYASILDGVEQSLQNGKPSFVMARVEDGKNVKDVSILKESFKSNLRIYRFPALQPFTIMCTKSRLD